MTSAPFTTQLEAALAPIIAYADARGVSPETILTYGTGNGRLLQAMRNRAARLDQDIARVVQYISDNPAPDHSGNAAENQNTKQST